MINEKYLLEIYDNLYDTDNLKDVQDIIVNTPLYGAYLNVKIIYKLSSTFSTSFHIYSYEERALKNVSVLDEILKIHKLRAFI